MTSHEGNPTKKALARFLAAVMIVSLLVSMIPAVALAAAADNSTITGTIPAAMTTGQSYTVKITVKNTGTTTWTAAGGYKLVCTAGAASLGNKASYPVPSSVKPKASVTFTVVMKAPQKTGKITSVWMMGKGSAKFGATLTKSVSVAIPANNCQLVTSSFPSSITVTEDNFDQENTLSVTLKNTGSAKWTSKGAYSLVGTLTIANPALGLTETESISPIKLLAKDSIATGASKKFVMPEEDSLFVIDGVYTYSLQMVCNKVRFGPIITKKVTVKFSTSIIKLMAQELITAANDLLDANDIKDAQTAINYAKYYISQLPNGTDKTKLQNSLDAVQAIIDLPEQKTAAITAIENAYAQYKHVDYSDSNWNALQNDETTGIVKIQLASAKADVDTAKADAINGMAAVVTIATQKVIDEISHLPQVVALADKPAVQQARSDYNALLDAQKALVTNYSTLTADEQKISDLELANAKNTANAAVDTAFGTYNSTDYNADNWNSLVAAKDAGHTNINNATTVADVTSAQTAAIAAMAAIQKIA